MTPGWLFPDLSGTWVGGYQYDPVVGVGPIVPTPFTVDLMCTWWGRVRGSGPGRWSGASCRAEPSAPFVVRV